MQNYVNLFFPEEREMLPLCEAEGIRVIPWSPLARGRLTRDLDETTDRSATDEFGRTLYTATAGADRKVVEAVEAIASLAVCRVRRSRSPGYSPSRKCPRRSSARLSRHTSTMPSQRSS